MRRIQAIPSFLQTTDSIQIEFFFNEIISNIAS
jgi:hypothetical protein